MSESELQGLGADFSVCLKRFGAELAGMPSTTAERRFEVDAAWEPLANRFESLLYEFLGATPEGQQGLYELTGKYREVLLGLEWFAGLAWKANSDTASIKIDLTLAAFFLVNDRIDFRDLYMGFGNFYLTTARSGLDPIVRFRAVHGLERNQDFRQFIQKYEESLYFRTSVAPKIAGL